jgi:hypothetical protein
LPTNDEETAQAMMTAQLAHWKITLAQPENQYYDRAFPFLAWLTSKLEKASFLAVLKGAKV